MTYTFLILDTNQEVEIDHPISQPALTELEVGGKLVRVKRLIAAAHPFHLKGDCWARCGYERGLQTPDRKD